MGLLCPAHPQMLLVGLHVAWVAGAQVSSSSCEGEGEMSFFQCSLDRFCVCVCVGSGFPTDQKVTSATQMNTAEGKENKSL